MSSAHETLRILHRLYGRYLLERYKDAVGIDVNNALMSSINPQVIRHLALPPEITDTVIDHLHDDIRTLGICGLVCSEWLICSRHHIFSTVQLWPWRARHFSELVASRMCTFNNQIRRIEIDDSRVTRSSEKREYQASGGGNEIMLFSEVMSKLHLQSFQGVRALHIQNFDWTTLPSSQQANLRAHISSFSLLNSLVLHGVAFHDWREFARVVKAFPNLIHLKVIVRFTKYFEHTLEYASTTHLPNKLISLELGSDEATSIVLSNLTYSDGPQSIQHLQLRNIIPSQIPYIHKALGKLGKSLQHLSLSFQTKELSTTSEGEVLRTLDLSSLNSLKTIRILGLALRKSTILVLETSLPKALASIESSFLETVELQFQLCEEDAMKSIDLRPVEKAMLSLHFFGMKLACVLVEIGPRVPLQEKEVEHWVRQGMKDLNLRGALKVTAVCSDALQHPDIDKCEQIPYTLLP